MANVSVCVCCMCVQLLVKWLSVESSALTYDMLGYEGGSGQLPWCSRELLRQEEKGHIAYVVPVRCACTYVRI